MSEGAKRHRCPECGESHMGFTELCGFCLASMVVEGVRTGKIKGPFPVTQSSSVENVTAPLESVSHGGKRQGAGRKRKYESNAARLRAWRKNNGRSGKDDS